MTMKCKLFIVCAFATMLTGIHAKDDLEQEALKTKILEMVADYGYKHCKCNFAKNMVKLKTEVPSAVLGAIGGLATGALGGIWVVALTERVDIAACVAAPAAMVSWMLYTHLLSRTKSLQNIFDRNGVQKYEFWERKRDAAEKTIEEFIKEKNVPADVINSLREQATNPIQDQLFERLSKGCQGAQTVN